MIKRCLSEISTSLGDLSDVFEDEEKTEKGFDDVKSILV
jgi:hypothetical protein